MSETRGPSTLLSYPVTLQFRLDADGERKPDLPHSPDSMARSVAVIQLSNPARTLAAEANAAETKAALRDLGYTLDIIDAGPGLLDRLQSARPAFAAPCVSPGLAGDGALQELLDLVRVSYMGSPASVVRACADKVVTKQILASAGLPTLPHVVISNRAIARWTAGPALLDAVRALGGSFVIKPVRGSGGMGVKLTTRSEDVAARVIASLNYDPEVIVEPYTPGHEFTVVVVGPPDKAACFGTAELTSTPAVTRFRAGCGDRSYRPATPPKQLETLATKAYRAMGCRDVALVDFIVDERGQPWILEVDTAPDFTLGGPVSCAAASSGTSVSDLIDQAVRRVASDL